MATTSERLTALETKVSALQTAMTAAQNNITALKAADAAKGARIAALEAKLSPPQISGADMYFGPMIEMTFIADAESGVAIASSF